MPSQRSADWLVRHNFATMFGGSNRPTEGQRVQARVRREEPVVPTPAPEPEQEPVQDELTELERTLEERVRVVANEETPATEGATFRANVSNNASVNGFGITPEEARRMAEQMRRNAQRSRMTFGGNTPRVRPRFHGDNAQPWDPVPTLEGDTMATVGHYVRKNPDLSTVVPHPLVVGTGRVGIEVELEQTRRLQLRNWASTVDNSLRNNGQEYILRQPLAGQDLFQAIIELDGALHEVQPDASWRCSTHIHLDVRDMPVDKFKKLILAYTCFEKIIFQCSGIHRWGNNFCPSFGFAEAQIIRLAQLWRRPDASFIQSLDTSGSQGDRDKYTAFNFLPISRQGSVEFRGSEAKFKKGQLLRLANRILSLKDFAMNFEGTEAEMIDYIATNHPSKVLLKSIPAKFAFNPDDLMEGCGLAQDIIYLGTLSAGIVPQIRTKNAAAWEEYLNRSRPNFIAADELYQLTSAQGRWPGDFIHNGSWDEYVRYCEDNSLPL